MSVPIIVLLLSPIIVHSKNGGCPYYSSLLLSTVKTVAVPIIPLLFLKTVAVPIIPYYSLLFLKTVAVPIIPLLFLLFLLFPSLLFPIIPVAVPIIIISYSKNGGCPYYSSPYYSIIYCPYYLLQKRWLSLLFPIISYYLVLLFTRPYYLLYYLLLFIYYLSIIYYFAYYFVPIISLYV